MTLFKSLSFVLATGFLTVSGIATAEQNDKEFQSWSEAVGQGFEVKGDIDAFLSILGDNGSSTDGVIDDSAWLKDNQGEQESDDKILRLLQDISRKQVKALQYSQKAVEVYYADYSQAQEAKFKACKISGLAKFEARTGIFFSKTDRSLSQPFEFQKRFETIFKKLERFRQLLECRSRR